MNKLLMSWHKFTFQRYELVTHVDIKMQGLNKKINTQTCLGQHPTSAGQPLKYLPHAQYLLKLKQICLSSSSKRLYSNNSLFGAFSQTLSCCGCGQNARQIKSKYSQASFKLIQGYLMGLTSHLRRTKMVGFFYKWFFLSCALDKSLNLKEKLSFALKDQPSISVGCDNIFVFELDRLDYELLEPVPGLDIVFTFKNKQT